MREYTEPSLATAPTGDTQLVGAHPAESLPAGNLTDAVIAHASSDPQRVIIRRRLEGVWVDLTAKQFLDEVVAVTKGMLGAGIGPGQRVGLMSSTRYEWTLLDYAIWFAGAVTVPIYETSSAEQVEWILHDSDAVALICETEQHAKIFNQVADQLPSVSHRWIIDKGAVASMVKLGRRISTVRVDERRSAIAATDLATIIYTSGTTGSPKGCMISHQNLMFEVTAVVGSCPDLFDSDDASTLLFLPLAHVFGRAIQVGCIESQAVLGHAASVADLLADLAEFQPTFLLSVPRVFEKIYNTAAQKAEQSRKGTIFSSAADTAIAYSRALDSGGPSLVLRLRHAVFDKLVYGKLRAATGGQVRYAVSGGAPLGPRLGHFFRGVGITILEGYGLTETSAAATLNRPAAIAVGSVGKPLPGTGIRIADDGEVLIRGPQVFSGYWKNEEATAKVFDRDGWFHSGDLGELDKSGYLRITGRKKEIIVTAGGKNVAPAVLEYRLRAHALVSQCLVVGDAQPFIAALVTLDPDAALYWAQQHHKPSEITLARLAVDPELIAEVQVGIDEANKAVSSAEAIKKFRILADDWTEAGGQLTPSLKLKRSIVTNQLRDEIAALYS